MVTNTYHFVYKSLCEECGKRLGEETKEVHVQSKKYSVSMDRDYSSHSTRSSTLNCQFLTQLTTPLINSQINSAYRKKTTGSYIAGTAFRIPYSKAGRALSKTSGPRRYRIDHRFQSKFYR
eukprot:TRINITY_DN32607_c0_g1_i1.p1 TRINITY_DN32607_c0_g1~~TRINITY_DN32607_c0_g1_i1.p1  ORF type:complete len:121 (-),score=15.75 TRINITY_DN32607_c0_g1_i1:55-417(-)